MAPWCYTEKADQVDYKVQKHSVKSPSLLHFWMTLNKTDYYYKLIFFLVYCDYYTHNSKQDQLKFLPGHITSIC